MNLEQLAWYTSNPIIRLSTFLSLAISLEDIEHKKTEENYYYVFIETHVLDFPTTSSFFSVLYFVFRNK